MRSDVVEVRFRYWTLGKRSRQLSTPDVTRRDLNLLVYRKDLSIMCKPINFIPASPIQIHSNDGIYGKNPHVAAPTLRPENYPYIAKV